MVVGAQAVGLMNHTLSLQQLPTTNSLRRWRTARSIRRPQSAGLCACVCMVRNRGRLRDPDDSPLRDGNRDQLFGLLTKRAARSLVTYLMELNQNLANWLVGYMHQARRQYIVDAFKAHLVTTRARRTRFQITGGRRRCLVTTSCVHCYVSGSRG